VTAACPAKDFRLHLAGCRSALLDQLVNYFAQIFSAAPNEALVHRLGSCTVQNFAQENVGRPKRRWREAAELLIDILLCDWHFATDAEGAAGDF
jgi:hypothetical protein